MKAFIKFLDTNTTFLLLLFYPLLLLIILGFIYIPFLKIHIKEIAAFGFTILLFAFPLIMVNNRFFRKFWAYLVVLVLSFLVVFKLSFYYHYGVRISASALFVIFESNVEETKSFLTDYFDLQTLLIISFGVFSLILLVSFKGVKKRFDFHLANRFSYSNKIVSLVLFSGIFFVANKRLQNENILFITYNSFQDYTDYKEELKSELNSKTSQFLNDVSKVADRQTHVVIIGESTSRRNMELYGYDRATNPELLKLKDELLVFRDVISPHTHTILSLDKILTLSDINEPNKSNNASLVQLANMAGYKTYWLSNQRPIGLYESFVSIISNASDEQKFKTNENTDFKIYDTDLLPEFENYILDTANKKVIFIHLSGTHSRYSSRYPYDYIYFTETDYPSKYKNRKAKKIINEYDNAIRHNDYVVSEIIKIVKCKNVKSSVVYFSDHGDDVYWSQNKNLGHNEYLATMPMYEVPFILWTSDKKMFDDLNTTNILSTPYHLEDFIHSFSDITGIKFEDYNTEKSIFSNDFKPKKRLIKNGIDYDSKN
ncbi:MAG: sulfatase-like hydrolase/transferase [Winogradskyella sp.]|uniref:sulfatase-like hydrolase/transferase n=1 Tax=Winogradskyella sp. TaxID=1883156 RepID=UPI0017EE391A|nr:sulfatase-like hydrolase/transferase [Winogradskyella sp.]MBT8244728.1 sulfatase-like hydrolase/transferase [Winogradskyella sp.]NNK22808.1 sulfatase-like hydrolase/transferase [Winogradskyella sp.]